MRIYVDLFVASFGSKLFAQGHSLVDTRNFFTAICEFAIKSSAVPAQTPPLKGGVGAGTALFFCGIKPTPLG